MSRHAKHSKTRNYSGMAKPSASQMAKTPAALWGFKVMVTGGVKKRIARTDVQIIDGRVSFGHRAIQEPGE